MKKKLIIILFVLFFAVSVYGDPRMEINENFAHIILDGDNTDNEFFISGAEPEIAVFNGEARGYVTGFLSNYANQFIPEGRRYLIFSSSNSNAQCVMVESNGTEYRSNNWISVIVKSPHQNDWGYTVYEYSYFLQCEKGQIQ